MPDSVPDALLWLFVINHGIAVGAGFYEQRIVLPQWFVRAGSSVQVDAEAMRRADVGRRFWAFVTTVPLTLLTLANLVVAWPSPGPQREWWLAAVAVTLVERVGTFTYFIPTAIRLMSADRRPPSVVHATAVRWMAANHVRAALAFAGWLLALKTLSLAR